MEPRGEHLLLGGLEQAESFKYPLSPLVAAWLEHADLSTSWALSPLPDSAFSSPSGCPSPSASSAAVSDVSTAAAEPSSSKPHAAPASSLWISSASSAVHAKVERPVAPPVSCTLPATVEQHRRADAQRRHRERAVLRRLEELSGGGEGGQSTAGGGSTARQKRKRHERQKLAVLEASALHIERLERLLNASELANRMTEAQVHVLGDEIHGMIARERAGMQWLDGSSSLRRAGMLGNRFGSTLIDCRSGRLLDANSAFFAMTGFTPSGVLQRKLDNMPLPADEQSADSSDTPAHDRPLVKAKRDHRTDRSSTTHWIPLQPCRQYPRTITLLNELLSAQRDSFRAPFRCRWLDGHAYEIHGMFWVVDVEYEQQPDGSKSRPRPLTFGCAASIDDYCGVEEE